MKTKEEIIKAYKLLRHNLQEPPSSKYFYKQSRISHTTLGRIYGQNPFSKLMEECGDAPRSFFVPKSDFDSILEDYGLLIRKLGRPPVLADWNQSGGVNSSVINRSHNTKWTEMPDKFLEFAISKDEWHDVVVLLSSFKKSSFIKSNNDNGPDLNIQFEEIYLIKSGKYYKIGKTKDFGLRGYQFKILLPEKPELVHKFKTDDPFGIEKYWHNRFANKRKNGEWFDLDNNDIKAFKMRKDFM